MAGDQAGSALPFPVGTVSVAGVVGGMTSAWTNVTAFEAAERLPHSWPKAALICAEGVAPAPRGEALSNATAVYVCGPAGIPASVNVVTSGPSRPTVTPSRRSS